jgi:hypothetical protein
VLVDTAHPRDQANPFLEALGIAVVTSFAAEGGRVMHVELSVKEQRYHPVMKVVSGAPGDGDSSEVARLLSPPGS